MNHCLSRPAGGMAYAADLKSAFCGFESRAGYHHFQRLTANYRQKSDFLPVSSCSLNLFSENANYNNITPKISQPQIEPIINLSREGITPKIPAKCTLDLCKVPYAETCDTRKRFFPPFRTALVDQWQRGDGLGFLRTSAEEIRTAESASYGRFGHYFPTFRVRGSETFKGQYCFMRYVVREGISNGFF